MLLGCTPATGNLFYRHRCSQLSSRIVTTVIAHRIAKVDVIVAVYHIAHRTITQIPVPGWLFLFIYLAYVLIAPILTLIYILLFVCFFFRVRLLMALA